MFSFYLNLLPTFYIVLFSFITGLQKHYMFSHESFTRHMFVYICCQLAFPFSVNIRFSNQLQFIVFFSFFLWLCFLYPVQCLLEIFSCIFLKGLWVLISPLVQCSFVIIFMWLWRLVVFSSIFSRGHMYEILMVLSHLNLNML